jgi:hypothetical protein
MRLALKCCLLFVLAGVSLSAWADNPVGTYAPCPQIGFANGCNLILTINSNGTVSPTLGDPNAYDGSDDQLVGIINNSNTVVTTLALSGSDIFGFENDGAGMTGTGCLIFSGNPFPCNDVAYGPTGYEGPNISFTITDANSGFVNFLNGGIQPGGTAWFSLENTASANGVTATVGQAPEPGSMLLIGTGLVGLAGRLRKKFGK